MNGDIYFYLREEEYGWLSNFHRAKQVVEGVEYPTNEHFYQSQKAKDPIVREWIRKAPVPYSAMIAGRALRPHERVPDWERVTFDVMHRGLRAKFSQNPDLHEKLLATGNDRLHENSPTDPVWEVKGEDMLGKLLMKVRDELRRGENSL